ncbi:DNA polymerase subunit gamma-1, mitochondrial [Microplitis demolitor]|uniref:DNA polymerase subunit gamma-1, mitochondrial n=1 Tax=Microplitis demolitor TaxID=69319 RepID=UPI0004CD45BD|nr:DNA polymerase subunit gamma-1, mitochondrial [Microplitis demolitor]
MRLKIKLLNICIRHKCSDSINDSVKKLNNVTKRTIRIKKCAKPINTPLTSTTTSSKESAAKNNYSIDNDRKRHPANKFSGKKLINDQFYHENLNDQSLYDDHIIDNHQSKNKNNENLIDNSKLSDSEITENNNEEFRFNELNMQMLSKNLHSQIFKNTAKNIKLSSEKLKTLREQLQAFGMKINESSKIPAAEIDLPPLEGDNLEEHFHNIAAAQARPYFKILEEMVKTIPEMPSSWKLQEGWTRYTRDKIERVDYPLEEGIIFDVEVCMKEGPLPTLATAVTADAWYAWVSKSLVDGSSIPVESRSFTLDMLIPIESTALEFGKKLNEHQKRPKIIVGHNVCYDRARIKEQYWLNSTGTRFVDTMSLHVAVSGMNSYQRTLMMSKKDPLDHEEWLNVTSLNNLADVYKLYCDKSHEKSMRDLFVEGTLLDVRGEFDKLMNYCAKDVVVTHEILQKLFPLFKERFPHPVTFAGMLELGMAYLPVNTNWQRYIEESEATFDDLNYEAKVSLAKRADEVCKLMHDDKYKEDLWMWDQDWSTQTIKVKSKATKKVTVEDKVEEESDYKKYLTDGEDEVDELEQEFGYLDDTKKLLPVKMPQMPGYPAWYRKLCLKESEENWAPGPQNISTSMKVTPKLLNLTWENYPLHHIKEHGWGFLVPFNNDPDVVTQLPLKQLLEQCPLPRKDVTNSDTSYAMATLRTDVQNELHRMEFWRGRKNKTKSSKNSTPDIFYKGTGIWCDVIIDNCCWFFKLPHKDGPKLNVGNPLAKDFLNKFSENVLAGLDSSATEVLKIAKMVSYWRNNRDRIMSQLVIWLNNDDLPSAVRRGSNSTSSSSASASINIARQSYGAIIPQVVVSGTLTRRATEATWMTASNAQVDRVGSELRSMVQAPPGYNIVGADVDSQELWIASLIGDAYCAGTHGATPFGWMTLIGNKSNGTDMHSVTAKAVGISRDHAKVINYARIYGAGQKFAERLLKQFNPAMTDAEALAKSRKMFDITKGKKVFRLKREFISEDLRDLQYTSYDAYRLCKLFGKSLAEMFDGGKWCGGSESAMFNRLEEIAGSKHPVTPFLNSRLSRALEVDDDLKDKYLPTKINWVVQSGAVDFLHLMLVCMRWLMRDNARFCLSFHDEIRYLVPGRFKYNAALAMHVTNLLTRSFCAAKLGIHDLPMSVAFFAAVEVDTVLRKEASSDCKTPSNPYGMESRYGIPAGESLDVWKAADKADGSLGPWHSALKKRKLKISN